VPPLTSSNVPALHAGHVVEPLSAVAEPGSQVGHVVAAVALWK
jgi:hypothetical protein